MGCTTTKGNWKQASLLLLRTHRRRPSPLYILY